MTYQDYFEINKNIFVTPLIGYVNAKFVDSGITRKVLCYTVDEVIPIIFNPIRYFDDSLVGDTIDNAQVESGKFIPIKAGTALENRTSIPGYIEDKCYGNVEFKATSLDIPDNYPSLDDVAFSGEYSDLEHTPKFKTVNGQSIVGTGNIETSTYMGIPGTWDTSHTMSELISSIAADTSAVPGKSYIGTVHLSDLPGSMIQAELIIEVMDQLGSDKTVAFQLSSADTSPYKWEYVSAYGASGTWRSWVPSENQTTITFKQW